MEVAPLAGAWIETYETMPLSMASNVAPLAGAWIETRILLDSSWPVVSHPSRVRGLKLHRVPDRQVRQVAPLAGAWIETLWGLAS